MIKWHHQSFHFLDVHYLDSLYFFRIRLTAWVYGFELTFNLLYSFGFYTWMVLLLLSISIIKRGLVSGFPYILCLLLILVCIASPVNDYGRYYMSVNYLIPLMCGYTKCGGMKKAG